MLEQLSREPQEISEIVKKLIDIFVDVDFGTLLSDTEEFFAYLASDGFVSLGTTAEECKYSKEISKFNNHDNEICIDNNASGVTSDDFLRSLHIEIANTCNERCVHCYIPHRYKTSIMDSSLFYKILEEGRIIP